MTKVFGIGWAKTGTTTLGECFSILGYNHQSQDLKLVKELDRGNLSAIMMPAHEKESFEDWPWILLYRELDQAFPGSRFILTIRETRLWLKSYSNMLKNQGSASSELNEIRRILYNLPFPNVSKKELAARYERHNADVLNYFKNRKKDLLVVNWEKGDGWKKLCSFLEKDIPAQPFPHANKGSYKTISAGRKFRNLVNKFFR